jgi:hypothetical protein
MAETNINPQDANSPVGITDETDLNRLSAIEEAARNVTFEQTIYDENGKLTYDGMRRLMLRGQSVLYNGSIISNPAELPTEAQLVKGDARRAAQARAHLLEQQAAIQAQLAQLEAAPGDEPAVSGPVLKNVPSMSGNLVVGRHGEGDTAGIDGDLSDPDSVAARNAKAKAEADAKVAEEQEAARQEEIKRQQQVTADAQANAGTLSTDEGDKPKSSKGSSAKSEDKP